MRFLLIVFVLLGMACGGRPEPESLPQAEAPPADLRIVNSDRPGELLDLQPHLSPDRTTLVEFYSDQCPPCREMVRVMEYLAEQNREIAIRRVDIDRRGFRGIDFDSPLAEQHRVESVPSFHIYAPGGRLMAQGQAARDQVNRWYSEAQLFEHAEDPSIKPVSERYRRQD